MPLLSDYQVQVADLLHDPNNVHWTTSQLTRYINEARRQVSMDTGCNRSLQGSGTTAGKPQYTFGQASGLFIAAPGSGYTSAPALSFSGGGASVQATGVCTVSGGAIVSATLTSDGAGYTSEPTISLAGGGGSGGQINCGVISANVFDVLDISILFGALRYPLQWRPWSAFSALMRSNATLTTRPVMWSTYGNNSIYLGPTPDQNYATEIDTCLLPVDLVAQTDVDAIPLMVTDPIKFYAAYLAKFFDQSYGESEVFLDQYRRRLIEVCGAYTRRIPDIYAQEATRNSGV